MPLDDPDLDGFGKPAHLLNGCQIQKNLPDCLKLTEAVVVGQKEAGERLDERFRPLVEGSRVAEGRNQSEKLFGEFDEAPEHRHFAAFDMVVGQDAAEQLPVVARHGIAQEEPFEARPPRVVSKGLGIPPQPVLFIDPPPDPHLPQPARDKILVRLGQPESGANGPRFQKTQNLGRGDPFVPEFEHCQESLRDLTLLPHTAVGNTVWDPFEIILGGIENRLDKGCISFDGGSHHQDIPGAQGGVLVEELEKMVVEHFNFPHGAVARVELERAVIRRDDGFFA